MKFTSPSEESAKISTEVVCGFWCGQIASRTNRWMRQMLQDTLLALACVFACFASNLSAQQPLDGAKPTQWRVIWTSDPATTATVSWSTAKPSKKNVLHWGEKESGLRQTSTNTRSGLHKDLRGSFELYFHHVRLRDLKPGTAYSVQMESDDGRSPEFYFVTAPAADRPFSLLFGGDSRSVQTNRQQVNRMIASMVADGETTGDVSRDILALAHGGDYIADGKNLAQWSEWLSDHELTVTPSGRLLPLIPARGNHDVGPIFNEVFDFPEDDANYYALAIGPQVRFVTLNSETSIGGDQAKWLEDELKGSRDRYRWLVAQYHRPAWPAVKSPSEALRHWVPLFERYYVDLVCEADGHNIKRTPPIASDKVNQAGVVYIGEGGLGVTQRTPKQDRWFLQSPGMADSGHHVQLLTFGQDELRYQCVLLGGKVRDTYSRKPHTHPDRQP
ncbi:MAG: metallophosphoesterase family protein [Pirellulaceae bacterium]|nr:metallophosphoesterase family protein [Planctomycetales bacterium]